MAASTRTCGLLMLLVLALGSATCAPDDPSRIGHIRFNDRKIDFYWQGVRIQSPAVFTWSERGLGVNGIDASLELPPDTVGSAQRLARLYHGTPYVDSLVSSGADWLTAVNQMGCEFPRRIRQAVLDERARANTEDRAVDVLQIQKAVARATALPMDSILAFRGWLYCSVKGGGRFEVNLSWSDAELRRDPCAKVIQKATRESCAATLKKLRPWLIARYASLVVADDEAMQTFSGPQGRRGKRELADVIAAYRQGGSDAARRQMTSREAIVSARWAMAIARRAALEPERKR